MRFTKLKSLALTFTLAACSSQSNILSSDAQRELEVKMADRVGKSTKADFVQEFGPANWCRPSPSGEESCRFYKKLNTKWMGEKTDRVHRETFDEVFADFDPQGTLKSYKVNAQR